MAEGAFEHNLGDSEVLTMFLAVVSFGYVARSLIENRLTTSESIPVSSQPWQVRAPVPGPVLPG